ncbi:MAG: hypothetical protein ABJA83_13575 [Burkholderiaceae bacterium]
MNISSIQRRGWLALITLILALVGCAAVREAVFPPIQLWQIAREVPGADPRWQRSEVGVRVWRAGREIAVHRSMELLPGDELETGPNAAAVIRFREAGDTVVLERSRVRVGSLEVIFGRMLALLRNQFTVSSENVVAGVEGTRFLFEVGPDRSVRVAVADGAVVCRSRQNAWPPVRLRANEQLASRYPNRAPPSVGAADTRELRTYEQLSKEVSNAPEHGWCCQDGQVVASWSNRCTGSFDTDRAGALRQCRPAPPPPPPPDPLGWCCRDGQVTSSIRKSQCNGAFYDNQAALAQSNCRAAGIR